MKKLWSNNYHHSNNDPKVDGSCKKEDWQTSNNPKRINPAHCQRPSSVKNVVVDVTCGGIPQQWMKARWRRRTRWGRGQQCGRQRHKWWNPKMESLNVTNSVHAIQGLNGKYPPGSKKMGTGPTMMSFVERTAVKSAPKKPCSMPDQKVSGTIRSCFLRPSCLRILFSLFVLGAAKDCCVIRYLIVAERSLRPDICSLPSFNQILRECKVQISFDRIPDYCLLREDLKMKQEEQQLRGSIPSRYSPENFLFLVLLYLYNDLFVNARM